MKVRFRVDLKICAELYIEYDYGLLCVGTSKSILMMVALGYAKQSLCLGTRYGLVLYIVLTYRGGK